MFIMVNYKIQINRKVCQPCFKPVSEIGKKIYRLLKDKTRLM